MNWILDFHSGEKDAIKQEQSQIEQAVLDFKNKWQNNLQSLSNPSSMLEAVTDFESLMSKTHNLCGAGNYYLYLRNKLDQNNDEIKALLSEADDFSVKMQNEIIFFEQAIAKIDIKDQELLLNEEILKPYRYFIKGIFDASKYQLSEKEEKIINLLGEPAREKWMHLIDKLISNATAEIETIEGKKEIKNVEDLLFMLEDKHKEMRRRAYEALNNIFSKLEPIAEAELNAVLKTKAIIDEVRLLPHPQSARLIQDDVSLETFKSLQKAVTNNFQIAHKYYVLKAKILGLDKISYYEKNLSCGDLKDNYSYEEALDIVKSNFSNLDPEFHQMAIDMIHGKIDAFPNIGKTGGAFCTSLSKKLPTYVMLNYKNSLPNILTIAHELGHAIHSLFYKANNHELYAHCALSTAEVASTFMEDFVLQDLLQKASEEEQLSLLMTKLDRDIATIFRQIACINFEEELHKLFREKLYLSDKEIGELFVKHMKSYLGEAVLIDEKTHLYWIYWSHIRNFFYNYSYAHGLLISKSLQNKTRIDKGFIEQVKAFMKAGKSDSSENIFKSIGVDTSSDTTWLSGIDEVKELLEKAEALAIKLNKIS